MTLTEKMEMLAGLLKQVETLQGEIENEVLQLKKTQISPHLKAGYTSAKRSFDYAGLAQHLNAPKSLIEGLTTPKTDWRKVALAMSPSDSLLEQFATYGTASVKITLLN